MIKNQRIGPEKDKWIEKGQRINGIIKQNNGNI